LDIYYPGGYGTLPLHGKLWFAIKLGHEKGEEKAGKNLFTSIIQDACLHRGFMEFFINYRV